MHELAITQCFVDAVCEHARGRAVRNVAVEVGAYLGIRSIPDLRRYPKICHM
ncbi:DUF6893 family small protein [Nocardia australiensis]|uniref:DUF6893 family small protein n=1 Tax=Nocardia australiensis TaxID=2887191 RepID=UPI0035571C76